MRSLYRLLGTQESFTLHLVVFVVRLYRDFLTTSFSERSRPAFGFSSYAITSVIRDSGSLENKSPTPSVLLRQSAEREAG